MSEFCIHGFNSLRMKNWEKNSRKFQRRKLEFALCGQLSAFYLYCIYICLHSIYFALDIISQSRDDLKYLGYYPFYIRGLNICRFWYLASRAAKGYWNQSLWIWWKEDCNQHGHGLFLFQKNVYCLVLALEAMSSPISVSILVTRLCFSILFLTKRNQCL